MDYIDLRFEVGPITHYSPACPEHRLGEGVLSGVGVGWPPDHLHPVPVEGVGETDDPGGNFENFLATNTRSFPVTQKGRMRKRKQGTCGVQMCLKSYKKNVFLSKRTCISGNSRRWQIWSFRPYGLFEMHQSFFQSSFAVPESSS